VILLLLLYLSDRARVALFSRVYLYLYYVIQEKFQKLSRIPFQPPPPFLWIVGAVHPWLSTLHPSCCNACYTWNSNYKHIRAIATLSFFRYFFSSVFFSWLSRFVPISALDLGKKIRREMCKKKKFA